MQAASGYCTLLEMRVLEALAAACVTGLSVRRSQLLLKITPRVQSDASLGSSVGSSRSE